MEALNRPKKIRIIGAVAAGTSAAAKARRNDETADITLYDMDEYISYSGCGLPYYIGGQVEKLSTLTPRDAAFFKKRYQVDVLTRHEVVSIDPQTRTLTIENLNDHSFFHDTYDVLVLSTGAVPVLPDIPGADLPHVFVLRNPGHAKAIRSYMDNRKPDKAVVIGAGFIGLEMVENLAHAGLSVSLVEKLQSVPTILDPDLGASVSTYLEEKNVAIYAGRTAVKIDRETVHLDDGTVIDADLVIVSVGIRPNTKLAESMGVRLGVTGAIAVDQLMRTNLEDVYACGDCAESYSVLDGRPLYRPLGSTANKTGRITGEAITTGTTGHRGILGTGIFRVFDLAIATTGLTEAEARRSGYDVVICHNTKPDRPEYLGGREMTIKAIADRRTEKLLGVQIIGFAGVDKRIDVFVTAMTAGLKVSDLFHLDLAYAPPFATTKDPVHYTGMILENIIERGRPLMTAEVVVREDAGQMQIIDTRTEDQYAKGHVKNAINIPHESLRNAIDQLDPDQPVLTYCNKGTTGNAAQNILINTGFKKVFNLSGGHRQYRNICPKETEPTPNQKPNSEEEQA